jgi:hypothetical protein
MNFPQLFRGSLEAIGFTSICIIADSELFKEDNRVLSSPKFISLVNQSGSLTSESTFLFKKSENDYNEKLIKLCLNNNNNNKTISLEDCDELTRNLCGDAIFLENTKQSLKEKDNVNVFDIQRKPQVLNEFKVIKSNKELDNLIDFTPISSTNKSKFSLFEVNDTKKDDNNTSTLLTNILTLLADRERILDKIDSKFELYQNSVLKQIEGESMEVVSIDDEVWDYWQVDYLCIYLSMYLSI